MILDARGLSETRIEAQVVIAGSGPAGIVLALELARQGFQVCLLEAGDVGYGHAAQALGGGSMFGDPYPRLRDTRLIALGGTSQVWAGWCRQLDPIDFIERPAVGNPGWPIDRSALLPFYRRAYPWFRLQPPGEHPGFAGPTPLPLDVDLIEPVLFQQSKVRFGSAYRTALAAARNLTVYLNAPVARAFADPCGDRVDHLEVCLPGGQTLLVKGEHFVLAAGGIENARLLLASGDDPSRAIGNCRGQVGRWFTEHAFIEAGFLVLNDVATDASFHGMHRLARARGAFAVNARLLERDGLLQAAISLKSQVESHAVFDHPSTRALVDCMEQWRGRRVPSSTASSWRTALRRPDRLAIAVHERLRRKRPPSVRWRLRGQFECQARPDNAVRLAAAKDGLGRPMAELRWRMSDLDLRSIRRAHALLDQALRAKAIGRLDIRVADADQAWREAAADGGKHHMGSTRMSVSAQAGVVDPDLKVHGVHNLYVAGSSVFPSAGYSNPTLTIAALSIRLAEHLAKKIDDADG